jgi:hypothetical protein
VIWYHIYSYIIWGYFGEYVNFCMFLWLSYYYKNIFPIISHMIYHIIMFLWLSLI